MRRARLARMTVAEKAIANKATALLAAARRGGSASDRLVGLPTTWPARSAEPDRKPNRQRRSENAPMAKTAPPLIDELYRATFEPVQKRKMGSNPIEVGQPVKLRDPKGEYMDEWPADLRVRQFPDSAPVAE